MSATKAPYVKNNDGTQVQAIGLGTYTVSNKMNYNTNCKIRRTSYQLDREMV